MATAKAINLEAAGPGERMTFDELRGSLPASWHVVWGRDIPTSIAGAMYRETDFIIVGDHVLFVCEEKHWAGSFTGNTVSWYRSDGVTRDSPLKQATDLARKLSGLVKKTFPGIADRYAQYNVRRGGVGALPLAIPHVILSEPSCSFSDVGDPRIGSMCSALPAAAARLLELDAEHLELDALTDSAARTALIAYLDGLEERPARTAIGAYEIVERLPASPNLTSYLARHHAGPERVLTVTSLADLGDSAGDAREQAERETAALRTLANSGVTPQVYDYFYEDDGKTLVVPSDPIKDRTPISSRLIEQAPPSTEQFVEIVRRSFAALQIVHENGVLHRNLVPEAIWLPNDPMSETSVFFTLFSVARISGYRSIEHQVAVDQASPYAAPELSDGYSAATPASDVYSLAASLSALLLEDQFTAGLDAAPVLAKLPRAARDVLLRALAVIPTNRPSVSEVIEACTSRAPSASSGDCGLPSAFEIRQELGSGATARTYLAYDTQLVQPQPVVFKVFSPEFDVACIQAEIRVLYDLTNEHIVRLQREGGRGIVVGEDGTCPYLVYTFLEGQTLEEYRLDVAGSGIANRVTRLCKLLSDALEALDLVHRHNLVHRDLQPRNLYVHRRDDGSEHVVLLDFGQAKPFGATGVGGTPYFRDLLQDSPGRPWNQLNDLYSVAASFFYALTGLLPFERSVLDGLDKSRLISPVGDDRASRVLQSRLLRALDPDPERRYQSAQEFRRAIEEPTQAEPPPVSVTLGRTINHNVDELRKYYRNSVLGNGANRGLGGQFGTQTYVRTQLDEQLLPAVLEGALTVVLFAGNPGDGKTTFLEMLLRELTRRGAQVDESEQAGWTARYNDRTFIAVNDAAASAGEQSADEYVHRVLAPLLRYDGEWTDFTILIAANDGRLLSLFRDTPYYQYISERVQDQLLGSGDTDPTSRVQVIDFKTRALVHASDPEASIVLKSLRAVTTDEMWAPCLSCRAKSQCPIRFNALSLSATGMDSPAHRLHRQFLVSHLRRLQRLTLRDARSVLSYGITGDLGCEDIHEEIDRGESPLKHTRLYFWLLSAEPAMPDIGLEQLHELDPDLHVRPLVDRALNQVVGIGWESLGPASLDETTNRPHVPTGLFRAPDADEVNRRRFYFEGDVAGLLADIDTSVDAGAAFSPFRHFDTFVDAMNGEGGVEVARTLLTGASRVIGVFGYNGQGLAVRPPTTTGSDSTVVKVFPADEFEIRTVTSTGLVEHVGDQLVLQHRTGAPRINLSLDGFELLARASEGYLPTHPEVSALVEELNVFARQLMQGSNAEILIVNSLGSSDRVVKDAARIVLVER